MKSKEKKMKERMKKDKINNHYIYINYNENNGNINKNTKKKNNKIPSMMTILLCRQVIFSVDRSSERQRNDVLKVNEEKKKEEKTR